MPSGFFEGFRFDWSADFGLIRAAEKIRSHHIDDRIKIDIPNRSIELLVGDDVLSDAIVLAGTDSAWHWRRPPYCAKRAVNFLLSAMPTIAVDI